MSESEAQQTPVEPVAAGHAEAAKAVDTTEADKCRKLARQLEFYFSDSNLPFDKFLFTTSQNSLPADQRQKTPGQGWVLLTTILSFKRMRPYQALGLTKVAAAVRTYASDLLEVDQHGTKVRRTRPIAPITPADVVAKSVYVKGFPAEEEYDGNLQEALEDWFGQWGPINQVRMRREGGNEPLKQNEKRPFKGSVFVEFSSRDLAAAFLELEPKPTFEGQSEPVEVMAKKAYMDMKIKEKGIDEKTPNAERTKYDRPFNAFRELRAEGKAFNRDRKPAKPAGDHFISYEGQKYKVTADGKLEEPDKLEYKKDAVLAFEGVGSGDFDFQAIKRPLFEVHAPTYVKHEEGAATGAVCFREPVSDDKITAIEALQIKAGEADAPLKWRRLTADEERQFHQERAAYFAGVETSDDRDHRGGRSQRGGRGRGRGRDRDDRGRGGRDNRPAKRPRDRDDEGSSPAKKTKTEAADSPAKPAKRSREDDATEEPASDAKRVKTAES